MHLMFESKLTASQSASYSSTAGVLHAPGSSAYAVSRPSDVGIDQRTAASPRSASSSAASHHAYAPPQMSHNVYHGMPAGLGIGPSGHPDPRLSVPTSAGAQPMHYSSELGYSNFSYLASPASGLPGTAQQSYAYQQRIPSLTGPTTIPAEARFVPLQDYEGHQTSTA